MPVVLLFFGIVWVNIPSRQLSLIQDVVFRSLLYLRIHELPLKSCKISSKLGHWHNFKVLLLIILMKSLEGIKACLLTKINVDEKNSHCYCRQDSSDRLIYFFYFSKQKCCDMNARGQSTEGGSSNVLFLFCLFAFFLLSSVVLFSHWEMLQHIKMPFP